MMLLRRAYQLLVRLHPQQFRSRYGQEMLWIYDDLARNDRARLFVDAVMSVLRQNLLRDRDSSLPVLPCNRPIGPVFATVDHARLPLLALWQGAAMSAIAWFALGLLITAGTEHRAARSEFAGVHYLIDSRIQPARVPAGAGTALKPPLLHGRSQDGLANPPAGANTDRGTLGFWARVLSLLGIKPLDEDATAVAALLMRAKHRQPNSSSRGANSNSIRPVLVLPAVTAALHPADPLFRQLDRNLDGRLSADEIDRAPEVLRSLDQNHDGKLTARECGTTDAAGRSQRASAGRSVCGILDQNGDRELSDVEITHAAAVLRSLARNSDGSVGMAEIERSR